MSSSGLIYAVIVGAWAAYLVPMWLRRQDELNEARPTERFGTAIRLLSGRAGMERRYARNLRGASRDGGPADGDDQGAPGVDVRALADPVTEHIAVPGPATVARAEAPTEVRRPRQDRQDRPGRPGQVNQPSQPGQSNQGQKGRAKLLARRRRTTMALFLAFTLGAIVAAVGGIAFLWAPAIPAGLLSAYIAHMRAQERRRFEFVMDRRHAEAAARHLRERRAERAADRAERADRTAGGRAATGRGASGRTREPAPEPASDPEADERRALVEQTDHAEWVDAQRRERTPAPVESGWEPTPVPLPTYVNAPVAPRTARSVDLEAPDAWSSARSTTASSEPARPSAPSSSHSSSPRHRTPLFDQYADEDRPRAANE
ncbi:divisome protein SepX/GlpR [Streptomyces sp. enrichment culture]|uniref:divisome protein SepX/GlpR n=1 Tax=Streptomyces sp. enrichment culture TaxID=1795815 RepID=UPI003F54FCA9